MKEEIRGFSTREEIIRIKNIRMKGGNLNFNRINKIIYKNTQDI